jgi:hypothetical protein
MPVILRFNGIDFFFYSNEHRPIHVHVRKANASAKVRIEVEVKIIESFNFSPSALKVIKKFCEVNSDYIINEWEAYFDEKEIS